MTAYLYVQLATWLLISGFCLWGLRADGVPILRGEVPIVGTIGAICLTQLGWPLYLLLS